MKTNSTFVWAKCSIELHAISDIDVNFTLIVNPRHSECENPVGFDNPFDDCGFFKFGMLVIHILDGSKYFPDGLKIFRFPGMFCFKLCHYVINFHNIERF